jgi:abelson tyrosine-protein kinase 1
MRGERPLTQQMDVYAFAICCGEILTKGELPWPTMDDDTVWRSVLSEHLLHYRPLASLSQYDGNTPLSWGV